MPAAPEGTPPRRLTGDPCTPPLPSEAPTRRPSDPHKGVGTLPLFQNIRSISRVA